MAGSPSPRRAKDNRSGDGPDLLAKGLLQPDAHRSLPQSPEAELGVLSSYLLAPREVGGICAEKRITGAHFHVPAHGILFETLEAMWTANQPVDFITVTQILRDKQVLDQVGGPAFITHYALAPPPAPLPSWRRARRGRPFCGVCGVITVSLRSWRRAR